MMKKWIAVLMAAAVMVMPMSAYASIGSSGNAAKEETEASDETAIETIRDDFAAAIGQLQDDLDEVYDKVGETYEEYLENKGFISEWYEDCKTSMEALFARTCDSAVEYYNYVASSVDRDYDSLDAAMGDFYDEILDDAFDGFYDDILDDAFDDIYDTYYDGIIAEGEDLVGFSEYLDECSDFYREWLNAYSELYEIWLDAFSDLYADWFAVYSAFVRDNEFDVDAILEMRRTESEEVVGEEFDDAPLRDIQNDVTATIEVLMDDLENIYEGIGRTYEEYMETKDRISGWYEECESEGEALLARTLDSSVDCYKALVAAAGQEDPVVIEDILDEYYELVLRDAFNGFYEEVINEGLNSIRDTYFEVIVNEDFDSSDVADWDEECKAFYTEWIDAYATLYQGWSNAFMDLYNEWSAVWNAFVNENEFDVDAILSEK